MVIIHKGGLEVKAMKACQGDLWCISAVRKDFQPKLLQCAETLSHTGSVRQWHQKAALL